MLAMYGSTGIAYPAAIVAIKGAVFSVAWDDGDSSNRGVTAEKLSRPPRAAVKRLGAVREPKARAAASVQRPSAAKAAATRVASPVPVVSASPPPGQMRSRSSSATASSAVRSTRAQRAQRRWETCVPAPSRTEPGEDSEAAASGDSAEAMWGTPISLDLLCNKPTAPRAAGGTGKALRSRDTALGSAKRSQRSIDTPRTGVSSARCASYSLKLNLCRA